MAPHRVFYLTSPFIRSTLITSREKREMSKRHDLLVVKLTYDVPFRAWIRYLTTEFSFPRGDHDMNQLNIQPPQYIIPEDASEETKQWISQAQERLNLFAGRAEYRAAYEYELLNMIDHNSSLESSYQRGREEGREEGLTLGEAKGRMSTLAPAVERLRRAGLDDDTIASSLLLTPAERAALMSPR
jgi:hypothetical protein